MVEDDGFYYDHMRPPTARASCRSARWSGSCRCSRSRRSTTSCCTAADLRRSVVVVLRQPARARAHDLDPARHRSSAPAARDPQPRAARARAPGHARRERVLVAARHPLAVALSQGPSVRVAARRPRLRGSLRAGRVRQRAVRRQLELARPGLVPDELPDHRGAQALSPLLRRQPPGRVPDRLGQAHGPRAGRRRARAPARLAVLARRERSPAVSRGRGSPTRTIRASRTSSCSTSTFTATTVAGSARVIRPAGPRSPPISSSASRPAGRSADAPVA